MIARSDTSWQTLSHCKKPAPFQIRHIRSACRHPHTAQQTSRPPLVSFSPGSIVVRLLDSAPLLLSSMSCCSSFKRYRVTFCKQSPRPASTLVSKPVPFLALLYCFLPLANLMTIVLIPLLPPLNLFFSLTLLDYVSHPDRDCFILTNKKQHREKSPKPCNLLHSRVPS